MKKNFILFGFFIFSFTSLYSQDEGKRRIGLKEGVKGALSSYFRKNWVLIIGIDKYQRATQLKYAVNDAKFAYEAIWF